MVLQEIPVCGKEPENINLFDWSFQFKNLLVEYLKPEMNFHQLHL